MNRNISILFSTLALILNFTAPAHATPPTTPEPTMLARCSTPSANVFRNLLRQAIAADLRSKGYSVQGIAVNVKTSSPRINIKLANISGFSSVKANQDLSGYQIVTSGDMSVGCVTPATVTIKGTYVIPADGATKTPAVRKTLSSTQTVSILGSFN
jgi:hypothetical protein